MTFLAIGDLAPPFTLRNQHDQEVSLRDLRGHRVVLYFYPKASTPGCTVQACGIRDTVNGFRALNAVVLGISPDPVAKLQRFVNKYRLNFDLLADEDHNIAESYGAWGPKKFMGKAYSGILRKTYIINGQGYLDAVIEKVNTKTHHVDVLKKLEESI